MNDSMYSDVSAYIIAGGKSRRFGEDKTLYVYRGKPLIAHVFDIVRRIFTQVAIVADRGERFSWLGVPCYPDLIPDAGPMGGIYTALHHSVTERTFIVAVDMPGLCEDLVRHLVEMSRGKKITVPCIGGRYEALHAVYTRQCLPEIEVLVKSGKLKIVQYLDEAGPTCIGEQEVRMFADPAEVFRNVNYQDDLKKYPD
ncbi:MAG TPA: molybdenum cofactor guanylyltransferase [Spirochaetota bacterium]|nr:molybdenum cofactor guanylyltransferase [Spirochaetota bacterium]